MRERRQRLSSRVAVLLAVAFVAIGGAASVPASSGCTTHQCDPSCAWWGLPPPPGVECDANGYAGEAWVDGTDVVWESSPVDGQWIDYRGSQTHTFFFPGPFAGNLEAPYQIDAWVSTSPVPQDTKDGGAQVEAAGQLAEFYGVNGSALTVQNATCTEYYLRIVARARYAPAPTDAGDAATDAASSLSDAADGAPDASDGASDGRSE